MPQQVTRARDIMERSIISVTPATRILDVHQLFVQEEIHGAPVVGEDGIVHGVISTLDLLRIVRDDEWSEIPDDLQGLTAADAMTRELVTIGPDAPVAEVAQMMLKHHIHRVLVVDDNTLLGVISSYDLMRVLGNSASS